MQNFVCRITALFIEEGATSVPGFADFALKVLQKAKYQWKSNGRRHVFGGNFSAADKRAAFAKMAAWHRLALSMVKTEFPDWEICASFAIFDLSETRLSDSDPEAAEHMKQSFVRLAAAFQVDEARLRHQVLRYAPVARQTKQMKQLTNAAAWSKVVQSAGANKHDVQELRHVLKYYMGLAVSTCGLERSLSRQSWLNQKNALHQGDSMHGLKAKLLVDYDASKEMEIIKMAQLRFKSLHVGTRKHTHARLDKGMPHKQAKKPRLLRNWLQKRAEAVKTKARAVRSPKARTKEELGHAWSATHEQEEVFQNKKRRKFQMEARKARILLPSEVDDNLDEEVRVWKKGMLDATKARAKKRMRDDAKRALRQIIFPEGAKVFFEGACAEHSKGPLLRKRKMVAVEQRVKADVFVTEDVGKLGLRTQAVAVLKGCLVLTADSWLSGKGPSLKLRPAVRLASTRHVYFSSKVRRDVHPQASSFCASVINNEALKRGKEKGKWSVVRSFQDFKAKKIAAMNARHPVRVIGIFAKSEVCNVRDELADAVGKPCIKRSPPEKIHISTLPFFLERVQSEDNAVSTRGVCGS